MFQAHQCVILLDGVSITFQLLDIVHHFDSSYEHLWSFAQDIMLRDEANHGAEKKLTKKTVQLQSHISYRIRYSLRVTLEISIVFFWCCFLFLLCILIDTLNVSGICFDVVP